MPTYGYECLSCHNQIEVMQSIKDDPLTVCEACGGSLRKRIYPVGIAFKGSGFYVNDYASPAPASAGGGGAEAKPDAPKTDAPKTDAPKTEKPKTETKSEPTAAA